HGSCPCLLSGRDLHRAYCANLFCAGCGWVAAAPPAVVRCRTFLRRGEQMADRVARVVWEEPRRRFGFGVGLALAIIAAVLLTGVLSTGSTSARSIRAGGHAAQLRAINGKVNALIAKMTLKEKFGQLTMAGPDGANGTPGPKLLAGARNGTIGT